LSRHTLSSRLSSSLRLGSEIVRSLVPLVARDPSGAGELLRCQASTVPSDHEANARAARVERPRHPLLQLRHRGLSQQEAGMSQYGQHVGTAGRQQVHVTDVAGSETQVRIALSSQGNGGQ
jgi:hypothetical protein